MKISIIGAGNMGGAIALGIAQSKNATAYQVTIIDHSGKNVNRLKAVNPNIKIVVADYTSIKDADIVVLATKPWHIQQLIEEHILSIKNTNQILVSVAAGIASNQLEEWSGKGKTIFRVIPNTAIAVGESMTFLTSINATKQQNDDLVNLFALLGKASLIDENQFAAGTALASCGIAFAFRYIRAAMVGGIELGFYPNQSKDTVIQTLKGAIALLENNNTNPEIEIDKVTTAGGITIKGLNEMEHAGFTSSVIKGLKASNVG